MANSTTFIGEASPSRSLLTDCASILLAIILYNEHNLRKMRRALLPQFALLASFKAQICHLLITAWHATIFFLGPIKVIGKF